MEKKVTKAQVLNAIKTLVNDQDTIQVGDVTVTGADIASYVDVTLKQLAAKAEKAKETAAKKRAEGDELREAVFAVLTDEFQTTADVFEQIEGEDLTSAKVNARLTQLVKSGLAVKEQVKVGDRKLMAYKRA